MIATLVAKCTDLFSKLYLHPIESYRAIATVENGFSARHILLLGNDTKKYQAASGDSFTVKEKINTEPLPEAKTTL